jgi:hypothetical protein
VGGMRGPHSGKPGIELDIECSVCSGGHGVTCAMWAGRQGGAADLGDQRSGATPVGEKSQGPEGKPQEPGLGMVSWFGYEMSPEKLKCGSLLVPSRWVQ